MKIVLVCAAGMSTSLIVARMKKEATNRKLDAEVIAVPMDRFDKEIKDASAVLLGPQIRFKLTEFEKIGKEYGIPVVLIDPKDYGMADGEKILDAALSLIDYS